MIKLDTFTLFISWKCNIACMHCGFSCGPWRKEKMSIERALKYIDEASQNRHLKMVAYSGGEPFIFYNDIKKLMAHSFAKGLSAGLVTNCYWAHDYCQVMRRLKQLKELGLDEIITSLDQYHLRYIPIDNFRNVIKGAIHCDIRVGINVLSTAKSLIDKEYVENTLKDMLTPDLIDNTARIWIRESNPLLVGRARRQFKRRDLKYYQAEYFENKGCDFAGRNVVVTPEGSLYACCGFGGASDYGPSSITYSGNLNTNSFKVLFDKLPKNLLLNIIVAYGPYKLLKLAQQHQPNLRFRKKYINNCDICHEISCNTKLRLAIAKTFHTLARSVKYAI